MASRIDISDVGNIIDDIAEIIANPPPNRPVARNIGESGQKFCDSWSNAPQWGKDAIANLTPAGRVGPRIIELVCEPYFRDKGYDPPEFEPPYMGGQCPDFYRGTGTVSYRRTFCGPGTTFRIEDEAWATEFVLQGPLGAVSSRVLQPGACGAISWGLFVQTATGEQLLKQVLGASNVFNHSEFSFTVSFERAGGLPDNCGDPPSELRPGDNPAPSPPPFPPTRIPGIDPEGEPFFFVPNPESPFGDFPLPTGDYTGGEDGGGGGGDSAPPAAGDEFDGEGGGQGGGDNDFGDPPEGERWVGCEVRLTDVPEGTGIIPQSLPQTIYTATQGNARLRFDSDGDSGYDTPIAIKSKSLWLWEPVRGANPAGVFVNLRPGLGYTVRPYSVPLEN